jgi:hypothetical protein
VLGEKVRVHGEVERAECSQGFGGGNVTSGGESSVFAAHWVSVQCMVDWSDTDLFHMFHGIRKKLYRT